VRSARCVYSQCVPYRECRKRRPRAWQIYLDLLPSYPLLSLLGDWGGPVRLTLTADLHGQCYRWVDVHRVNCLWLPASR
jgi:hypothetical protein